MDRRLKGARGISDIRSGPLHEIRGNRSDAAGTNGGEITPTRSRPKARE
jgi:hypothetical protein